MKKTKRWFLLVPIAIVVAIVWNSFSQPGLNDFISDFKEVGLYRNENNTGPVERVYIVTTNEILRNEMERYSGLMPYSKLGITKVYFFSKDKPYPAEVQGGKTNFDAKFEAYCVAKYEKNSFGATSFSLYPFNK